MSNAEIPNNHCEKGPLPIVIGVTGHRDLRDEDIEKLREAVRSQFAELLGKYPHTSLSVSTALAEGADRLVAEVALEMGLTVNVIMPMPQSLYETDWDAESNVHFNKLIGKVKEKGTVFELPILEGNDASSVSAGGNAKSDQFQLLGDYIASNCHILMALWDGQDTGKAGGTWEVVKYKLDGSQPLFKQRHVRLDTKDVGPVIYIHTPRKSSVTSKKAGTTSTILPGSVSTAQSSFERYFEKIFGNIERFNADSVRLRHKTTGPKKKALDHILTQDGADKIPANILKIAGLQYIADAMASHYQRIFNILILITFALVFLSVVSFEIYAHTHQTARLGLSLYVIFVALAFIVFIICKRAKCQDRHQDYRALAEAMRVLFYWRMAGIPDAPTEHYLRKQRSELDWIRGALLSCNLPVHQDWNSYDEEHWLRFVKDDWIKGQMKYYEKAARRDSRNARLIDKSWGAILITAIGAAGFQAVFGCESHTAIVAIAIISLTAGLVVAYGELRALPEQASQYARVAKIFAHGETLCEESIGRKDFAEAKALVLELGKEALAEHGDWLLVHRDKPFDVPYP